MEAAAHGLQQLASSVHALSGSVAGPGASAVVAAANKLKEGLVAMASPTISFDDKALLEVQNLAATLERCAKVVSQAADGMGDKIVTSVKNLTATLDEHSFMWLGAILVLVLVAVVLFSLAWSHVGRNNVDFVAGLTRASAAMTIAIGVIMMARPPPLLLVPLIAVTTLGLCLFAFYHENILRSVEQRLGIILALATIALLLAAMIYGAGFMQASHALNRAQSAAELEIRIFELGSSMHAPVTSCKSDRTVVRTSLQEHDKFPLKASGPAFVVSALIVDHVALDNQIIEADVTGHLLGGAHRGDVTLLINGEPIDFYGKRFSRQHFSTGDLLSHASWIPVANRWVFRVSPGTYKFQVGLASPTAGAVDVLLHQSALRIIAKCDELYDYFPENDFRVKI